jgi:AraC family transcriptional activator of pobA
MRREELPSHHASASSGGPVLNVPAYCLYGEDWTQAIFGFFHIEALSVRNVPNKWRIALHRHPDFDQLSILFRGRCGFEHDGREFAADAPSCVHTPANVVHQFAYEPGSTGFVISVSSDFAAGLPSVEGAANTALLRLTTQRIVSLPSEKAVATTRSLIELLVDKAACVHRYRRDTLRYLFGALLLELDAAFADAPDEDNARTPSAAPDLFRRYRDLVLATIGAIGFADVHRQQAHTVEAFAAQLSSTPYALNAACQSVCGCPAREVVHTALLEQATRLLLYTDRPMKDISFLLGYSHASHFARFFKQRRGTTPEAFRSEVVDAMSCVREPQATRHQVGER